MGLRNQRFKESKSEEVRTAGGFLSRFRIRLTEAVGIAQIIIAVVALVGLFYSVIPGNHLSNLRELIELKQLELERIEADMKIAQKALDEKNQLLNSLSETIDSSRKEQLWLARMLIWMGIRRTSFPIEDWRTLNTDENETIGLGDVDEILTNVDVSQGIREMLDDLEASSSVTPQFSQVIGEEIRDFREFLRSKQRLLTDSCKLREGQAQKVRALPKSDAFYYLALNDVMAILTSNKTLSDDLQSCYSAAAFELHAEWVWERSDEKPVRLYFRKSIPQD